MTYAEAVKILNDAADYAHNQRALCAQINELKTVRQRLTAAYGMERVKSSAVYLSPAQAALEKQDDTRDALTALLEKGLTAFTQASDIIKQLPTFKHRSALNMHYCLGMSHKRIADTIGKSLSSARRLHVEALDALRMILDGEDNSL